MEPKVNYTVVGLFVVVLTAVIIFGLLWFSAGKRKEHLNYLVYMNEAVTGLSEQAPVKFNGVEVGYVSDISLNPRNPAQVRLILSVVTGTPINQTTVAKLMLQGITGVSYIGLRTDTSKQPLPLVKLPGEKYPIIPSAPSLLVQLDTTIRELSQNLKSIRIAVQGVFTKENQQALSKSLANIAEFTDVLAKNSKQLGQGIKNASSAFAQGKTAAQTVSEQALPQIIQAINKLTGVINNLDQFSSTLKNNPAILIRGKATPSPGPGE